MDQTIVTDPKVALLLRLTDSRSNSNLGDFWISVGCLAILGVNDFNARNNSVVPELAGGNLSSSSLQMSKVIFDTTSVGKGGIKAYRNALAASAHGVVGAARSAASTPVANLGSIDKIPQISYWSSSPALSDKSSYSHFARTFPSDAETGKFLMTVISHFGWKFLGAVYVVDPFAQGLINVMQAWPVNNPGGASIPFAVSHTAGDTLSVLTAVAALKASGLNIIVFITLDADVGALFEAADNAGMLTPKYVWLTADSPPSDSVNPVATANRMAGVLTLTSAAAESAGYARLAQRWPTLSPADCANSLFDVPARIFTAAPPDVGAYAYDAAVAFGLALAAVVAQGGIVSDGDAVLEAVKALSFDGAAGPTTFDANGDRVADGLTFALFNLRLNVAKTELLPMDQSLVGRVSKLTGVVLNHQDPVLLPIVWKVRALRSMSSLSLPFHPPTPPIPSSALLMLAVLSTTAPPMSDREVEPRFPLTKRLSTSSVIPVTL